MTEICKGVDKYIKLKEAQYAVKAHDKTQVNFCDKSIQCHIQAILLVNQELMFFADGSSSRILSARLQYDGYGICAFDTEHVMYYSEKLLESRWNHGIGSFIKCKPSCVLITWRQMHGCAFSRRCTF